MSVYYARVCTVMLRDMFCSYQTSVLCYTIINMWTKFAKSIDGARTIKEPSIHFESNAISFDFSEMFELIIENVCYVLHYMQSYELQACCQDFHVSWQHPTLGGLAACSAGHVFFRICHRTYKSNATL